MGQAEGRRFARRRGFVERQAGQYQGRARIVGPRLDLDIARVAVLVVGRHGLRERTADHRRASDGVPVQEAAVQNPLAVDGIQQGPPQRAVGGQRPVGIGNQKMHRRQRIRLHAQFLAAGEPLHFPRAEAIDDANLATAKSPQGGRRWDTSARPPRPAGRFRRQSSPPGRRTQSAERLSGDRVEPKSCVTGHRRRRLRQSRAAFAATLRDGLAAGKTRSAPRPGRGHRRWKTRRSTMDRTAASRAGLAEAAGYVVPGQLAGATGPVNAGRELQGKLRGAIAPRNFAQRRAIGRTGSRARKDSAARVDRPAARPVFGEARCGGGEGRDNAHTDDRVFGVNRGRQLLPARDFRPDRQPLSGRPVGRPDRPAARSAWAWATRAAAFVCNCVSCGAANVACVSGYFSASDLSSPRAAL